MPLTNGASLSPAAIAGNAIAPAWLPPRFDPLGRTTDPPAVNRCGVVFRRTSASPSAPNRLIAQDDATSLAMFSPPSDDPDGSLSLSYLAWTDAAFELTPALAPAYLDVIATTATLPGGVPVPEPSSRVVVVPWLFYSAFNVADGPATFASCPPISLVLNDRPKRVPWRDIADHSVATQVIPDAIAFVAMSASSRSFPRLAVITFAAVATIY